MPITWQQLNRSIHLGHSQDTLLKFKLTIRIAEKGHFTNFECGMAVCARWTGLTISKIARIFSHHLLDLQRIFQIRKKNPRSSSSLGENALLMLEVRGEWLDHFELIGKQQ